MVHWFQGSFPDGCLGDEVLTGDLSLGLILEVLGGVVIVSSQVFPEPSVPSWSVVVHSPCLLGHRFSQSVV